MNLWMVTRTATAVLHDPATFLSAEGMGAAISGVRRNCVDARARLGSTCATRAY